MSETHKELMVVLNSIRPTYHQRHLVFLRNGGFDTEISIQQAATLFKTVESFKHEVLSLEPAPIDAGFELDCQSLVEKMEVDNRQAFFKHAKDLESLLSQHIPASRDVNLFGSDDDEVATPINREVMELLKEQRDIVLDKLDEFDDTGDTYDEDAFLEADKELKFSRDVYNEQLRTNAVKADLDDVNDCKASNDAIQAAGSDTFVEQIKTAGALLKSKTESEPAQA